MQGPQGCLSENHVCVKNLKGKWQHGVKGCSNMSDSKHVAINGKLRKESVLHT